MIGILADRGVAPLIVTVYKTVSNKYVDLTFNVGVYADMTRVNPVTTSNFSIVNLVPGGVTVVAISAVKRNNHYTAASATDLIGGELNVRVFLTLTGTPDSTESFQIQCTDIFGPGRVKSTVTSSAVKINITPLVLWDFLETASYTTLSLGVDAFNDVMGVANFAQGTDSQRPVDGGNFIGFDRALAHQMSAGDIASLEFQKGNSFTVIIKRLNVLNSGTTGYIISKRGPNASPRGWSISTGVDGSLFFVLHDGSAQGFCDYDAFAGSGEATLFFINNNGTMNIRNAAGTALGTTGNATGIGTITYGTVPVWLGRRETETDSYLKGWVEKIAIVAKAMSNDEIADFNENMN